MRAMPGKASGGSAPMAVRRRLTLLSAVSALPFPLLPRLAPSACATACKAFTVAFTVLECAAAGEWHRG